MGQELKEYAVAGRQEVIAQGCDFLVSFDCERPCGNEGHSFAIVQENL